MVIFEIVVFLISFTNNLFMEIQNSTIEDLEFIFALYKSATEYQKERFISHWPEFDQQMVINEILALKQWKMIIDEEVVCIWATTFSDPLIWGDRKSTRLNSSH